MLLNSGAGKYMPSPFSNRDLPISNQWQKQGQKPRKCVWNNKNCSRAPREDKEREARLYARHQNPIFHSGTSTPWIPISFALLLINSRKSLISVCCTHLSHHGLKGSESQFQGQNLSRFTKTETLLKVYRQKTWARLHKLRHQQPFILQHHHLYKTCVCVCVYRGHL